MFERVTVRAAKQSDIEPIKQLFQLYLHDLSEFRGTMPDPSGLHRAGRYEARLAEPGQRLFRFDVDDRLAGFAMVRPYGDGFLIAECFVIRAVRGQGVAARAAGAVLHIFPGSWSVPFQDANKPAARFWRSVVSSGTVSPVAA